MEGKLNNNSWFPIILMDNISGKMPKLGLTTGDITTNYSYQGDTSLSTYYPSDAQFKSTGSGIYWLQMGSSEFTNEGVYQVSVYGTGCLTYNFPVECRAYTLSNIYDFILTMSGNINITNNTLNTVSGDINSLNNLSASEIASEVITSGNVEGWNLYSDATLANQTSIINYINTISGNIDNIDSELDLVTVSGITPEALTQIVNSGNTAGWENTADLTTLTNTINTISGNISTLNDISVSDILNGTIDGITTSGILEILLAYSQGKIERSDNTYVYKKQDNSTTLFTLTVGSTERTRS